MATEQLTCFVIMPFGTKDDVARGDKVRFDDEIYPMIQQAVEEVAKRGQPMACVRADKIAKAGWIHEQMIQAIADADVAVADLTTANANVYYEIGVRHTLRDRVTVLLRRKGTRLQFNLAGMKTIEYDTGDEAVKERARHAIAEFIWNGLRSGDKDSLVHAVLPGLKAGRDPKPVRDDVEEYEPAGLPGKCLGILCGDLRSLNQIDKLENREIEIVVNSENTGMQMARPTDASISGLLRYLGAERDATSTIVRDSIADELAAVMGSRQLVGPGEVVATGPGHLARTHKLRRIYHVASVYGTAGKGFRPIANPELCVVNALTRLDEEAQADAAAPRSILFPLLGTGNARADIVQNARTQVGAVLSYLRARARRTKVERVYFMAPNVLLRSGLRVAFAELLGSAPAAPPPAAVPPARQV
jgi:O-acetyl-ADP-ribose deacetylase (regulator of RNase III)